MIQLNDVALLAYIVFNKVRSLVQVTVMEDMVVWVLAHIDKVEHNATFLHTGEVLEAGVLGEDLFDDLVYRLDHVLVILRDLEHLLMCGWSSRLPYMRLHLLNILYSLLQLFVWLQI